MIQYPVIDFAQCVLRECMYMIITLDRADDRRCV